MPTTPDYVTFEQIQFGAVTRNGFSDVSILTAGEARGHGMIVDETTIDTFMKATLGKTIPAYLTHAGALQADGQPADRLGKEIGFFSGIYRDGDKVRANFQFLDSFIKLEQKAHTTLVEMAQNFADKLGVSPVAAYLKAWVMGDGKEVITKDGNKPAGAVRDLPSMRVRAIKSFDFVQSPAANVGLFEARVDEQAKDMADTILLSEHTAKLDAKGAEIVALSTQHKDAVAALEVKHTEAVALLQTKLNEQIAAFALEKTKADGLTAALAAKTQEAADAGKYDMRKCGVAALEVALQTHRTQLPAPAATDMLKWAQFTELNATNPAAAAEFKAKYLSRK